MKPTGRMLAAFALFVAVACATGKAQIGDDAPGKDPAVTADGGSAPAEGAPDAGPTPPGTAAADPVGAPPAAAASAEEAKPADPSPAEPAIDPTAGATGEHDVAPSDADTPTDPAAEETTGDGLKTESLESRASGRPDHARTLKEIVQSGYIRVLTRNNDTSFFIYRGHRMGFDY
jgi:hypothetical protein